MTNEPQGRSAAERLLDQALEYTFPASDPVAIADAFASAYERERRRQNEAPEKPEMRR
ncbi:MAG TPA: hypothetical protein VF211_10215 [Burkholderiales bacterium]